MFDQRFVRMCALYLAGSMVAFQTGGLQLFQVLFNRADNNQVARTRNHMYGDARNGVWTAAMS